MAKKGFRLAKNAPETLHLGQEMDQQLTENAATNARLAAGKFYQGYFPRKGVKKAQRVFRVSGLPLRHHPLHTEAAMTWGDMSAESADLAFSILWNYFQGEGNPVYGKVERFEHEGRTLLTTAKGKPAFLLYRAFHREIVSRWPVDQSWLWSAQEMKEWVAAHRELLEQ